MDFNVIKQLLNSIGNNIGNTYAQGSNNISQGLNSLTQRAGQFVQDTTNNFNQAVNYLGSGQWVNDAPEAANKTFQNAMWALAEMPQNVMQTWNNATNKYRDTLAYLSGGEEAVKARRAASDLAQWRAARAAAEDPDNFSYIDTNGVKHTVKITDSRDIEEAKAATSTSKNEGATTTETDASITAGDDGTESEEDVVTYTYKPGDTFGQVIMNLGLMTDKGLWGPGGDVEYYTQQLIDQDMLDANGNVKLNKEFKLRRRK